MRVVWLEKLSEEDALWIADEVNRELTRIARTRGCGERAMRRAAARLKLIIKEFSSSDGPNSVYWPGPQPGDPATIYLNTSRAWRLRGRILAHEIAHHLLQAWVAQALYGADWVMVDGDAPRTRHKLARYVERLRPSQDDLVLF